jgi:hypothetical protein
MSYVDEANSQILNCVELMLKCEQKLCQIWFYLKDKEDFVRLKKELETNPNSRICHALGRTPENFPNLILVQLYLKQLAIAEDAQPKLTTPQAPATAETSEQLRPSTANIQDKK